MERLRQRLKRIGIGRLADLLEHYVQRLARLRIAQLDRQSMERLRRSPLASLSRPPVTTRKVCDPHHSLRIERG